MKSPISKMAIAFVLGTSLVMGPRISFAADPSSNAFSDNSLTSSIGNSKSLLQEKERAKMVDLNSGTLQTLIKDRKVLDAHVLSNPSKIVLLTEGTSHRIEKHVYDQNGKQLSRTIYKVSLPDQGEARWAAPSGKVKERIMTRHANRFTLYEAAGKAVSSYSVPAKSKLYEHIGIDDWDFSAYPYLAVEQVGQRTMAEDYNVQIINLYNKSVTELKTLPINKKLDIDSRGHLNVWSSYRYEEVIPANAAHADPAEKQSFHTLYSISTGKALNNHKLVFPAGTAGRTGGWETQVVGDTVYVRDLSTGKWSLYPSNRSTPIVSDRTDATQDARFVGYVSESKTVYFLLQEGTAAAKIQKIILKS
ncbi:hypothetical protein QWJ34_22575 [Saccharibacillus sp. CPCC 101409]|uniref:hypothetical protein n=1 Tax=Saccharibacillus sp. CPCC 101409 TaxID=3058041 RepID=UPI002671E964|nr:hypothetical protein [Saccharibacillus sp. CPCC 101409]MDO3412568.1 hypothetical protein [Saccharibacillus sp. CPCC 101409]